MQQILTSLRAAFTLVALFTFLLGGVYPIAVTTLAQAVFNHKANGSLIERDGKIIGSELLGQQFTRDDYFWGRLSATTPPYNAAASSGSNLSPANPKVMEGANARLAALQKADPSNKVPVPVELITASASGLDPNITVAAAEYQAARVARVRHMKKEDVLALIDEAREPRGLAPRGKAYVNLLKLNLSLDRNHQEAHAASPK